MSRDRTALASELIQNVPVGVIVWELEDPSDDDSLRLIYANPAAAAVMGDGVFRSVGQRLIDAFPDANRERMRLCVEACRDRRARELGRVEHRRPDGETRWIQSIAVPVLDRAVAVMFENRDALQRAESEASSVTQFLDSIIEHLPAMVFVKDAETLRFERFNRAGEELLGLTRDQLIGRSDYDFFPKEQADFFVTKDREVLRRGTLEDIPAEPIETPRGTRWLHTRKIPIHDAHGVPRHLLGVSVDITERREAEATLRASHDELERRVAQRTEELARQAGERERAEMALAQTEEQLRQSQKMEAIGRLAGGVAHDFNNILSVVLGYCESLLDRMPAQDPLRRDVQEIRGAGERAAELTRQLLAFSRQQVLQPRAMDLNEVVQRMERMIQRLVGEDVDLDVRTASGLSTIKADPGQIEQVILNLVVNARDAMPTGGRLSIETQNVVLDEAYVAEHLGARAGPHVMLAITDSGIGMDRETVQRIFEPFFTTKERGKGSGLGLSMVLGIVQQSGGTIWVYTEPGKGATFKVLLPAAEGPVAPREVDGSRELRGTERVLLVEDNEQVRTLTARLLQKFGYDVITCANGVEALQKLHSATQPVHLLLTDVVMPEMSGPTLAKRVATTWPELRVLFMSGYTDDAVVRHGLIESQANYLQKPFRAETLAKLVRETLERPPGPVLGS